MWEFNENADKGLLYASRMQYLVGSARTRSSSTLTKERQRRVPCNPSILKPPLQFMTRPQARAEAYLVRRGGAPPLLADGQAAERLGEQGRATRERSRGTTPRVGAKAPAAERRAAQGAAGSARSPSEGAARPSPEAVAAGKARPKRRAGPKVPQRPASTAGRSGRSAWERRVEYGVTYWYNAVTDAFTAENPFPDGRPPVEREDEGAAALEEEHDNFAFLDSWSRFDDARALPGEAPPEQEWYDRYVEARAVSRLG